VALLTPEQIDDELAGMPGWEYRDGVIVREYEFADGFVGSIRFVNRLADAAEAANHHPDLAISWNKVTVTLSTHSEGGVTQKDISLAAQAEGLASG